jgi:serine/threonine protein kinase/WD40 repeat protein
MNDTEEWSSPSGITLFRAVREPDPRSDDGRLTQALEVYRALLESGRKPDRQEFLARYPEIAAALSECLAGLEFVHAAAPELSEAAGAAARASSAHDNLPARLHLGDYQIVREVGRGGMGVVYEAVQLSLGRRVALKVLPFAAALDARQLQRFKHEAQAAAHLHHQNIVPVYGIGCARDVHYYAMQFIDGQTLAAHIEQARSDGRLPDPRKAARWARQAAEALEHAHQTGVVHRDIKPANLMIDGRDDLWITDFGLAHFQSSAGITRTGDLVGTLRYMSPEQALGRQRPIDHRTDIYSLGATLYELLTLRPALGGEDRQELLRQVISEEPRPPRRLNRAIPIELEVIVSKAMAKEPEERYATARELADDLQRFLDDQPIRARRATLGQQARRWTRRHRSLAISLALSAALLLVGLSAGAVILAFVHHQREIQTEGRFHESLLREASAHRQARQPGYRQKVWQNLHEAMNLRVSDKKMDDIRAEVLACLGDPIGLDPISYPSARPVTLQPIPTSFREKLGKRSVSPKCVHAVSPDGELLALCPQPNTLMLLAREDTGSCSVGCPLGGIYDLQFTPDGQSLVAGCEQGVVVWDVWQQSMRTLFKAGNVLSLSVHPGGRLLAISGQRLELWSLASNRLLAALPAPAVATTVAFSADGKLLLAVVNDQVVRGWPVSETPEKLLLYGHQAGTPAVAFSPDGRLLASVSKDGTARIWESATGQLLQICRHSQGAIEAVTFSPDGQLLATGDVQGTVRLWDPGSGQEAAQVNTGSMAPGQIWRLQFSPSGRYLAVGGERGVAIWRRQTIANGIAMKLFRLVVPPETARIVSRETPPSKLPTVYDLAIHPAESELVLLSRSGRLHVCELEKVGALRTLNGRVQPGLRNLQFDARGEQLTFVTAHHTLGVLDWHTATVRDTGHKVFHVALTADGRRAVAASPDHEVTVYELPSGREVLKLPAESSDIWDLTWNPDGTRVAVALSDGCVAIWDLEQVGARLAEFQIDVSATAR